MIRDNLDRVRPALDWLESKGVAPEDVFLFNRAIHIGLSRHDFERLFNENVARDPAYLGGYCTELTAEHMGIKFRTHYRNAKKAG